MRTAAPSAGGAAGGTAEVMGHYRASAYERRSSYGLHSALPAKAVPHSENIGDVYTVIEQAIEHTGRLEILANPRRSALNIMGKGFNLALPRFGDQAIENLLASPMTTNITEFARNI